MLLVHNWEQLDNNKLQPLQMLPWPLNQAVWSDKVNKLLLIPQSLKSPKESETLGEALYMGYMAGVAILTIMTPRRQSDRRRLGTLVDRLESNHLQQMEENRYTRLRPWYLSIRSRPRRPMGTGTSSNCSSKSTSSMASSAIQTTPQSTKRPIMILKRKWAIIRHSQECVFPSATKNNPC